MVTGIGNKTEDPSVPYAGQGYVRLISKMYKRCESFTKPSVPLRNQKEL